MDRRNKQRRVGVGRVWYQMQQLTCGVTTLVITTNLQVNEDYAVQCHTRQKVDDSSTHIHNWSISGMFSDVQIVWSSWSCLRSTTTRRRDTNNTEESQAIVCLFRDGLTTAVCSSIAHGLFCSTSQGSSAVHLYSFFIRLSESLPSISKHWTSLSLYETLFPSVVYLSNKIYMYLIFFIQIFH